MAEQGDLVDAPGGHEEAVEVLPVHEDAAAVDLLADALQDAGDAEEIVAERPVRGLHHGDDLGADVGLQTAGEAAADDHLGPGPGRQEAALPEPARHLEGAALRRRIDAPVAGPG